MNTREVETTIMTAAARSLIESGFVLHVNDGLELVGQRTQDVDQVIRESFTTGQTLLCVYSKIDPASPSLDNVIPYGWVLFIHGNGIDVLADSTDNLSAELESALAVAEDLVWKPGHA